MGGRAEDFVIPGEGDPDGWIRDVSDSRLVRYVLMMRDRRNWHVRISGAERPDPFKFLALLEGEVSRRASEYAGDKLERMIFGSIRNL